MEDHKTVPAKELPEGWTWIEYDDGSGHLEAPDGKRYYNYDLSPYHAMGGIEYRETIAKHGEFFPWDIFWGTLTEFKELAESRIKEGY